MIYVGRLRWCANRYRVLAFVAEGDLTLAFATSLWFREGHGYQNSTLKTAIAAITLSACANRNAVRLLAEICTADTV